jgi:hypothetical protein
MADPSRTARQSPVSVVWLILVLGIVTTALGIAYAAATHDTSVADQIIAGLFISAGSSIGGASISLLVVSASGQDTIEEVRETIASSLRSKFVSDEKALQCIRREWHHYHVTEVDAGLVWSYHRYRFDRSVSVGSIEVEAPVIDAAGREHLYRAEAGMRGSRLMIIDRRSTGTEQPAIHIYPDMAEAYRPVHSGIAFLISWHGHPMVTKAILSQTRLVPHNAEGVLPPSHNEDLDSIWDRNFPGQICFYDTR